MLAGERVSKIDSGNTVGCLKYGAVQRAIEGPLAYLTFYSPYLTITPLRKFRGMRYPSRGTNVDIPIKRRDFTRRMSNS